MLDDLSCMLGCTRSSLHVVASEKGVVVGRLTFREDGDFIDCARMGVGGKAIPPNVDKVSDIQSDALFILLVEKDAAFMRLAGLCCWLVVSLGFVVGGSGVNRLPRRPTPPHKQTPKTHQKKTQQNKTNTKEDRFYNDYPAIIMTAKGQPDVASRLFLRKLKTTLKIPVLGLVDADP